MSNHEFCRALAAATLKDVHAAGVPTSITKQAWTYAYSDGRVEFQLPSLDIYQYGQACCRWAARVDGWEWTLKSIREQGGWKEYLANVNACRDEPVVEIAS